MAMSAEHRSKFAALHRQWWRLHMSEKFSSGTKTPNQTKQKQGHGFCDLIQKPSHLVDKMNWQISPFYNELSFTNFTYTTNIMPDLTSLIWRVWSNEYKSFEKNVGLGFMDLHVLIYQFYCIFF